MRTIYTTEGDINAKKQKDAYPKLALCESCVRDYVVIEQGERTTSLAQNAVLTINSFSNAALLNGVVTA